LRAEVKGVSCDSVLALFPTIGCVENFRSGKNKCSIGPVTILVVDQVLRACRTRRWRYGDLAELECS